jgi:hypothetical protein
VVCETGVYLATGDQTHLLTVEIGDKLAEHNGQGD